MREKSTLRGSIRRVLDSIPVYTAAFFVVLLCLSGTAFPESRTFEKDYTYQASDFDSKISSRTIALEQVKRLLLEELGTYLTSRTEIRDLQLTQDQVSTYSAGLISASIIDERWNGVTYYLKAKLTVDPDEHIEALKQFIDSTREKEGVEASRKNADGLSEEIAQLREELKRTQSDLEKMKQYQAVVEKLSATDWYEKGLVLGRSGNVEGAIEAHTRAIDLDPGFKEAYSMRALLYVNLGDTQKATANFISAARLGDTRAQKLMDMREVPWRDAASNQTDTAEALNATDWYERGLSLGRSGDIKGALDAHTRAIELNPQYKEAYSMRALLYVNLGDTENATANFISAARLGDTRAQKLLSSKGIDW